MNKFTRKLLIGLLVTTSWFSTANEGECKYLENGSAVEQYLACIESKSAALNAVIELIASGDYKQTKAFLQQLRTVHPDYTEVVELTSAINSALESENNLMELVAVLAKVKMQSLFESVKLDPFNTSLPTLEKLPPLVLQKDEFETTMAFEERKFNATNEHRQKQMEINMAYSNAMLDYNAKLKIYKNEAEKIISAHKKEVRKSHNTVLSNAFKLVMGEPKVRLESYDADNEIYYARMFFSNIENGQTLALNHMPRLQAKSLKGLFSKGQEVSFDVIDDKQGYLHIKNIQVQAGERAYKFEFTDNLYLADSKPVFIDTGDALLSTAQLEELDIEKLTKASFEDRTAMQSNYANAMFAFNNQVATLSQYASNLIYQINLKRSSRNANAVAVIIGNRDYKKHNRDIANVDYAINDAALIREYVKSKLGIAETDIIYRENTSQSDLNAIFGTKDNTRGKLADFVNDKNTKVFVFYSGHGTLGLEDKYSYLIPIGGNPNNIHLTGYKLDTMYANLKSLPTDDITVVIDACFSGQSNNAPLIRNASAVYGKPKDKFDGEYHFNIFSATSPQQIASWDVTNKLGIFTKHFVEGATGKADLNGDNKVTVAELRNHLSFEVQKEARREYDGRQQSPQILGRDEKVISVL